MAASDLEPVMDSDTPFPCRPIGRIHSCFREKFGIPRQPGLAPDAQALLELLPPYASRETLNGLEGFSHVWVVFVFHQALRGTWRPTVRPPRLGGNRRIGVFASRAPFRPNPIGLSACVLQGIEQRDGRPCLRLGGVDLLDGTPVLDIKPYLPYSDAIPEARAGYAQAAPPAALRVAFDPAAEQAIAAAEARHPGLRRLIAQVLAADPRPAWQTGAAGRRRFGMHLWDYDLQWTVAGDVIRVTGLLALDTG